MEQMRAMLMQNQNLYPSNIPPPTDSRFGTRGVPIGTTFDSRDALARAGIHSKQYAGISGSVEHGAFSIVVSGGYADDNDQGDFLVYTGTGKLNFTIGSKTSPLNFSNQQEDREIRSQSVHLHFDFESSIDIDIFQGHSAQVQDQTFAHRDNRALQVDISISLSHFTTNYQLKRSAETRRPVRVVRGPGVDSPYAPTEGYRFDGMYVVEEAYLAKGVHGYAVCKYNLRRVPGQSPIPKSPPSPTRARRKRRSIPVY
ncbi:hypothetical protein H0H93_005090 [Arthromyces matolae]|nr:hypothetical protein H0H93_005090 [Arthromyces matolae]